MAPIERATLFTVGSEEDGKKILETYKTMKSDAKKVRQHLVPYPLTHFTLLSTSSSSSPSSAQSQVNNPSSIPPSTFTHLTKHTFSQDGKPYIVSLRAGSIMDPSRAGGHTVAVFATYASLEDMKYYDDEDPAHTELKKMAKTMLKGPPTVVFFEDVVGN